MQDLQNTKLSFKKTARAILWAIFTIIFCWGWFTLADAAATYGTNGDKCASLMDVSEYAVWECHGATCLYDCNTINPDKPDYCAHVCAGVW